MYQPLAYITPHFQWFEFESWQTVVRRKREAPVPVDLRLNVEALCAELEVLRAWLGNAPITVICGYRTVEHNEHCYRQERAAGDEKSGKRSQHLVAKAADIRIKGHSPEQVYTAVVQLIELGKMRNGGVGIYPTFVHYDIGPPNRRW